MTEHSFQCPACGAPLVPRGSAAIIRCPHCQTAVIVPEELREDLASLEWDTLLYDNFMSNEDNHWLVGSQSSDYFDPVSRSFKEGRYHWEAKVNKANSISKVWLSDFKVSDFHVTVNAKHIFGTRANSAWGIIFHIQDNQYYSWFRITDSKFFSVSVSENGQWRDLVEWTRTEAIKPNGVNELAIIVRGTHHVFLINGQIVREVTAERFHQGLVGLAIEGYTKDESIIFDFLDFTLRGTS